MIRELRNLTIALLIGFVLIAMSSIYWTIFQHEDLLQRHDNPRRIFVDQDFPHGLIVDRHNVISASTEFQTGFDFPQNDALQCKFDNMKLTER